MRLLQDSGAALIALLLACAAPAAHASAELARAKACMACHQVDSKRVGPAYQAVAERYAGKSDAEAHLINSIRKGGRGHWGAIPMPAQPQVSEAEAQELARWILSQKK